MRYLKLGLRKLLTRIWTFKKDRLKYLPILLFSFFPYVTLYSFGSDIQPWSILFVSVLTLLLFYKNIRFDFKIFFLLLPFLYSLGLLVISSDTLSAIRSVIGYLTISMVPFSFYYILKYQYYLFEKFLKVATIIYFIVGLVQILFYKQFMSFLLNRLSSTENRGVTSLVAEPTFYGISCLFLILIFISLDIKNKEKYIYLLLFQIVFLAQSSMTILFLLLYGGYYFLFKVNSKVILWTFFGLFILVIVSSNTEIVSQNIRVLQLIGKFIEEPSNIFIVDASINDRVSAIYFSFKGFFDNYMLANGFGTYKSYLSFELPKQTTFWWVSESNRIMSYYGSILFELGFIGLIVPFVYSLIILKAYRHNVRDFFLYLFFINTILLSAIPLSFPFVGIYMATLLYKAKLETPNTPQ